VAPVRLGILGKFQDRYLATITATEVAIFKVEIQHLEELSNLKTNAKGSS